MRRLAVLFISSAIALVVSSSTTLATTAHVHGRPTVTARGMTRQTVPLGSGRAYAIEFDRSVSSPRPLVIMLPGRGEPPAQLEADARAYAFGEAHHITVVYGLALPAPNGTTAWNAGICCDGQSADDVGYLRDVVNSAATLTPIDPHRVYLIGMSNGGMLALGALCAEPSTFTAAVSVAGPFLGRDCPRPSWLLLAGSSDAIVPIHGGHVGWCHCTLPSTADAGRKYPAATVQVTAGANHTWPQTGDGSWRFDGMTAAWSFLSRYRN